MCLQWGVNWIYLIFLCKSSVFFLSLTSSACHCRCIATVAPDHTHTHSVGFLWKRDRFVAETSTWQHISLTTDRQGCPRRIRTRNPSKRAAAGVGLYVSPVIGRCFYSCRMHRVLWSVEQNKPCRKVLMCVSWYRTGPSPQTVWQQCMQNNVLVLLKYKSQWIFLTVKLWPFSVRPGFISRRSDRLFSCTYKLYWGSKIVRDFGCGVLHSGRQMDLLTLDGSWCLPSWKQSLEAVGSRSFRNVSSYLPDYRRHIPEENRLISFYSCWIASLSRQPSLTSMGKLNFEACLHFLRQQ